MLYLFRGPNSFSIREEIFRMRDSLGPSDLASLNYTEAEASTLGTAGLASLAQTMPFLSEKRLVVVRGLLAPFEPRQKPGPAGGADEPEGETAAPVQKRDVALAPILSVLLQLPPTTDLVLVELKVSLKNPLFSGFPKGAVVREFPLPMGADLENWILKRAKGAGGVITAAAAHMLAENVGPDLWTLDSEVQKLLQYTSGRPVEEAEVRLLVSQVREANVFAMVDAVMASRPGPALGLVHQLMDGGTAPSHLLSLLARQVRLLLQAKDLAARGTNHQKMAETLGLRHDWMARKLVQQAAGHSFQRLTAFYHRLVEEDLALKTGKHSPEVGLDLLVLDLCRP